MPKHGSKFKAAAAKIEDRHLELGEAVALAKESSFAKFDISGADAQAFLSRIFANRMPRKVGAIALAQRRCSNGPSDARGSRRKRLATAGRTGPAKTLGHSGAKPRPGVQSGVKPCPTFLRRVYR